MNRPVQADSAPLAPIAGWARVCTLLWAVGTAGCDDGLPAPGVDEAGSTAAGPRVGGEAPLGETPGQGFADADDEAEAERLAQLAQLGYAL